jgi:hypothetical protein
MRGFVRIILSIILALGNAIAQQPATSPNREKPAELPAASGTPEPQTAPELLPDSTILPASPPELRLPAPINLLTPEAGLRAVPAAKVQLSPEEQARIQARLSQLRTVAERIPRAANLLRLAEGALSDEAKREFMRAYQHTVCNEMRRLEPRLQQGISDYERTQIRRLAQGPSHLFVASRRSQHSDRQRRIKSH